MTDALDNIAIIVAGLIGIYSALCLFAWLVFEDSRASRLVGNTLVGLLFTAVAGVLVRGALRLAGLL